MGIGSVSHANSRVTAVGIIVAIEAEADCLTRGACKLGEIITLNERASLIVSGIGSEHAGEAATRLVAHGVRALVSFGTAAGLEPGLKPGDLLLPNALIDRAGHSLNLRGSWRDNVCAVVSRHRQFEERPLGEATSILAEVGDKRSMRKRLGVVAADMESIAVAKTADDARLPVLVLRSVVDSADMVIPRSVVTATDEDGRISLLRLAASLLRRPVDYRAFVQLGLAFRHSQRTLKQLSKQLMPDFLYNQSSQ